MFSISFFEIVFECHSLISHQIVLFVKHISEMAFNPRFDTLIYKYCYKEILSFHNDFMVEKIILRFFHDQLK